MIYSFTKFGGKISLTVNDDIMRYLGNEALTKKMSNGF